MPPVGSIWNIEWLNENSQRAYPLSSEATRQDITDSFTIPNDFIVDFIWPIQASTLIDPAKFHISKLVVFGAGVSITLAYDGTVIGTVAVAVDGFTRNSEYLIQGRDDYEDTIGRIVIGSLDTIVKSAGSYNFALADARFETTTIRPNLRGISSVRLLNGAELSEPIYGDIILQAGTNFKIERIPAIVVGQPDRIQFSAISGEGTIATCSCSENATGPEIRTINGVGPDLSNNVQILGDDCIEITGSGTGKLQIADKCSKPCCGCAELNVVTTTQDSVLRQVNALENLASRLESAMDALQTNLLSSKLDTTL